MTTLWPSTVPSRSEMMRAIPSVGPPAGKGTITLIGRFGYVESWACARPMRCSAQPAHSDAASRALNIMSAPEVRNTYLVIDPVQAPPLRHAFELVNTAILEADSRLRHQILDRARDQDFA